LCALQRVHTAQHSRGLSVLAERDAVEEVAANDLAAARETRGPSSPVGAPLPQRTERLPEAELSRRTGRHGGRRDTPTRAHSPGKAEEASPRRDRRLLAKKERGGRDYKFTDPRTGEAPAVSRGRNMRSRCRCSMCPAIHINSRSWLRSSSTHEPSDPPHRVVFLHN
jgi:hypothetical protein